MMPKTFSDRPPSAPIVVGLGEVLWDVFDDEARFGGAPANFASHAAALGAQAWVVSGVGQDPLGERALDHLAAHGVQIDTVARIPQAPTGSVQVRLDGHGSPHFTIHRHVAWDHIPWTDATADLAPRAEAVCFGTLAQREEESRRTIQRFVDATRPNCWRVFDVNLRQDFYDRSVIEQSLQRCNVLKLSDEELLVLARLFHLDEVSDAAQLEQLIERFDLQLAVLTLGGRGATLMDRSQTVSVQAEPVRVRDTVGAGDAFAATITMGLLADCDLRAIAEHACRVAGYVCSQDGAVPILPPALRRLPVTDAR